ncbi:MAG: AMP-binding protein, partial [Anaerolineae bacterium]|nr:AMP-binding protein [Anaerolineae bacterium]
QPVPIGVPGDLYISGDGLAQGYHHRPELTKEKFIDHPVVPGTPLYHTGDVARWRSDGTIEYLGRLDHQVKLRGFRIELGEIEAVLSRHPRVENCVVLAREDTPGDKRLVAYVVARPTIAGEDASVEAENQALALELRQYLKQQLPDYMIPSAFVRLNSLPLTPNGKIDHKVLPTPEWQATTAYVAPQTATQESLIQIWTEVLHVEQMGIDDDFFELGGHSLLATQLVTHIRDELHVSVPLRDLFVWPTVAGLAKRIETLRTDVPAPPAALPELIPIPEMRYKPFPLTEVQRAYWLGRSEAFELGRVATHAYVEVEGTALDLARLEGAWQR